MKQRTDPCCPGKGRCYPPAKGRAPGLQELLYFIFIRVISEVGIVNNGVKKITVFEVRRQRRNGISLVDMLSTHPPILSLLVTL
jgi:hypothetical protein